MSQAKHRSLPFVRRKRQQGDVETMDSLFVFENLTCHLHTRASPSPISAQKKPWFLLFLAHLPSSFETPAASPMRLLPTNLFLGYREMSGASRPPNTGLKEMIMISCTGWATRKPFRRHRWSVVPIQAKCFRIGETDASFRIIMPLSPKNSLSGQEACASVVREALKTIGFRACVYASETELMGVLYRCQASRPGTGRCWRSISGRRSKRRLFPIIGQSTNSPLRYQVTLSNRAPH